MSTRTPGLDGEPLRTYRTLPARVIGVGMLVAALAVAVTGGLDLAQGGGGGLVLAVALVVGLAVVSWVLFLRPHVRLHSDGVHLVNIVTDTTVPFADVQEVTHQWALELHDRRGRRHSAWAVPVRREVVRRKAIDDFAETTRRRGAEGTTAQGAADDVLRALQRWRLDGGQLPPGAEDATTQQQLAWPAIVALGVAISLTLLAVVA